jgi:hypothetical protein
MYENQVGYGLFLHSMDGSKFMDLEAHTWSQLWCGNLVAAIELMYQFRASIPGGFLGSLTIE